MAVPNRHDPETAEWWRQRLLGRLLKRNQETIDWWLWYYGEQQPPDVQEQYSAAYTLLLKESRHAWAKLVCGTINERLQMTGFVTGNEDLSLSLWRDFKRNHMDADQRMVHLDALVSGTGYVSVWPVEGMAQVSAEASTEVIHEFYPDSNRTVAAALKLFFDDIAGVWRASVHLPDEVYNWYVKVPVNADGIPEETMDWTGNVSWVEEESFTNPLSIVPFIPFINEPDLYRRGHSEIQPIESTLRRIDRLSLNLLLAAETAAFRQKWATGLKIPKDPTTGEPVQPFNVAMDKLWATQSTEAKFGTFDATTLDGYIKALGEGVAQLAAISRVPAHYLLSTSLANPPTAESQDASESGLISKVEDRQDWWGEGWESVVRLMAEADKSYGRDVEMILVDAETIWENAKHLSEAAVADAALKWAQVGMPKEVIWTRMGANPTEIVQWRNALMMEQMEAQLLAPAPPAVAEEPEQAEEPAG